jgi:hypothetical protein
MPAQRVEHLAGQDRPQPGRTLGVGLASKLILTFVSFQERLLGDVAGVDHDLKLGIKLKPGQQPEIIAIALQRAAGRFARAHDLPLFQETLVTAQARARLRDFPNDAVRDASEPSVILKPDAIGAGMISGEKGGGKTVADRERGDVDSLPQATGSFWDLATNEGPDNFQLPRTNAFCRLMVRQRVGEF